MLLRGQARGAPVSSVSGEKAAQYRGTGGVGLILLREAGFQQGA